MLDPNAGQFALGGKIVTKNEQDYWMSVLDVDSKSAVEEVHSGQIG
jgi:hypothetical protein